MTRFRRVVGLVRHLHSHSDGEEIMSQINRHVLTFLKREDGPTAVEYAVMMALIIVACMATLLTLGTNSNNTYSYVGQKVGKTAAS
jgi:pilus assembly protein Flp/PilA